MFTLYDNIVRICDEHGVKPSRMCVEAGISKSIMTRLKKDKTSSITTDIAQKIADYFGISVEEVLTGRKSIFPLDAPLLEMKEAIIPKDDGLMKELSELDEFIQLYLSAPSWIQEQARSLLEAGARSAGNLPDTDTKDE